MTNKKPLVSVIMPVYNAGSFVVEAIESMQLQTYKNWELIAIDDASTDNSLKILKKLAKKDKRIRVLVNKTNRGVSATANLGLKKAKGDFIARMDADDIAYPTRLEKQVAYLQVNKDTVAVGGQCDVIDREGNIVGEKQFPLGNKAIYKMLFTKIPIQQPSVVINKTLLPSDFVWYDNGFTVAEEVELMFKLFKFGKLANLPDKVLGYRIHGANISLVNPKKTFYDTLRVRITALAKHGYKPTVTAVFVVLAQLVVVSALPNKLIYPLYAFLRGMKSYGFELVRKPVVWSARIASYLV